MNKTIAVSLDPWVPGAMQPASRLAVTASANTTGVMRHMTVADAMAIRVQWLRLQGVPEDEIAEQCDPALYPADLAEELANLRAIQRIRQRNLSDEDLEAWASLHKPPVGGH